MNDMTPTVAEPTAGRRLTVSESAAKRITVLIAQDGDTGLMLRLSVSGGGCSGFQYGFSFDKNQQQDDHLFERDGVKVVVDDTSLDLLAGAEIDSFAVLVQSGVAAKPGVVIGAATAPAR